ncbi:MAG: hypothetical protein E7576_07655 [Ruminococcaceae bacterium]|nr:hypothetical protein [Oscillospiraceae bacterium]
MILVSLLLFSVGVLVLTGAGMAYTYKGTRYSGIDSVLDSERKKYDEKDHRMYAILSGLSYAGFSVGAVAIFVAMVMFFLAISTK